MLAHRAARPAHDPLQAQGCFLESERAANGEIVPVATVLLTGRECPWRCVMCDLWKGTLDFPTPQGAIPSQIEKALRRVGPARHLKLYNSGSFFDAGAVPPEDYPAIAERAGAFERVIVECHPALVGGPCLRFRDLLARPGGRATQLEVAMGLETAHPEVLRKLNKGMTVEQFAKAAGVLREHGVALRVFVLVQPPFLAPDATLEWTTRSVSFAFDCGASVVSLIPTRPGNGALDALARSGEFTPPHLWQLEAAAAAGVMLQRGRVFADVWDLELFSDCPGCLRARVSRLRQMNLTQVVLPPVVCARCGA